MGERGLTRWLGGTCCCYLFFVGVDVTQGFIPETGAFVYGSSKTASGNCACVCSLRGVYLCVTRNRYLGGNYRDYSFSHATVINLICVFFSRNCVVDWPKCRIGVLGRLHGLFCTTI